MKAQSAIEFITAYSWAFLLILLVAFLAFYYMTAQQPAPQCNFGTELQCQSFKFFKNSSSGMRFLFQLNNGMGKVISFNGSQIITVTNVGKSGTNNYTGVCWGRNATIEGGDTVYCSFNITDTDMIPSVDKNIKFDVSLNYTDCESSPNYPLSCEGGLARTYRGSVTATFEARPGGLVSYCGDGSCTTGENCSNCPADCGPCVIPFCQPDCTLSGICIASCSSKCLNFRSACNTFSSASARCSDSSGGTSGALDYYVSCCNGMVTSAPHCYQITSTTVGYCGDYYCDGTAGENCSNCPHDCPCVIPSCQPDCTLSGICNASCSSKCSGFNPPCNGFAPNAKRCSNSTYGTSGVLDHYVSCCNGAMPSAPNCYQITSTTVGWCGDRTCDSAHGEICSNCPADCGQCQNICLSDCTFNGACNQSCSGTNGCSNFRPACDTFSNTSLKCSNSTGGASPPLNYYVSCCNGTVTSCPTNSTCQHTTAWCNGTTQNCSDALQAPCTMQCSGGVCGSSCTPTCTTTCGNCPVGTTCSGNGVCTPVCLSDCTFGGLGICNSTCSGSCSNFRPACDTFSNTSLKCSNSTGGTLNTINYKVSCCNGAITNCANISYCSSGSCITCSPGSANCNNNSADACEINTNTDKNNCGYCGHGCYPGYLCLLGNCYACQSDCTVNDSLNICHYACKVLTTCTTTPASCDGLSKGATVCSGNTILNCCTGTVNKTCSSPTPNCCSGPPAYCASGNCGV